MLGIQSFPFSGHTSDRLTVLNPSVIRICPVGTNRFLARPPHRQVVSCWPILALSSKKKEHVSQRNS